MRQFNYPHLLEDYIYLLSDKDNWDSLEHNALFNSCKCIIANGLSITNNLISVDSIGMSFLSMLPFLSILIIL